MALGMKQRPSAATDEQLAAGHEQQLEDDEAAEDLALDQLAERFFPAPTTKPCCTRGIRACCPTVFRSLKTLGYEQAFILKGWTHVALWISCIVSFGFSCIWFSEVFTLKCITIHQTIASWRSWLLCIWEAIGLCIFATAFTDSVRMIAHFDDHKQTLLRQKWEILHKLNEESSAALQNAKQNVATLRRRVTAAIEKTVVEYVANVFSVTLPAIASAGGHARGARLTELLRGNLLEAAELSAAFMKVLAYDHEDAYKNAGPVGEAKDPLRLWDSWTEVEFPRFSKGVASHGSGRPRAVIETEAGSESFPDDLESFASGAPGLTNEEIQILFGQHERSNYEKDKLSRLIAHQVLEPVKGVLRQPERFARHKNKLVERANVRRKEERKRLGCGLPPQKNCCGLRIFCCINMYLPRLVACLVCNCYCFPRRFCRGQRPVKVCQRLAGFDPPKQITFGCCWIQIFTKLQERLLQGLLFSTVYVAFYSVNLYRLYEHQPLYGEECLPNMSSLESWRSCAIVLVNKFVGVFSMMCYIPSLCFCLFQVRRLDQVMETMETIDALQELKAAVGAFSNQMDDEAGSISFLKALKERVLCRLSVVDKFDKTFATTSGHDDVIMIADGLISCLEQVEQELKPASEWFQLSEQQQAACVQNAKRITEQAIEATSKVENTYSAAQASSAVRISDGSQGSAHSASRQPVQAMSTGTWELESGSGPSGLLGPVGGEPTSRPSHAPLLMRTDTQNLEG